MGGRVIPTIGVKGDRGDSNQCEVTVDKILNDAKRKSKLKWGEVHGGGVKRKRSKPVIDMDQ